jgi:hypothetical protein
MPDRDRNAESFLTRWSRRKLAAGRDAPAPGETGDATASTASASASSDAAAMLPGAASAAPATAVAPRVAVAADAAVAPGAAVAPRAADASGVALGSDAGELRLPAVESLTFDSDFAPFMAKGVDPAVRQAALRKLLHDPRFNVMDGLDVYIDDYTRPSPIAPGVVRKLAHARYLFDPPRTRVNAAGHVEDVPQDAIDAAAERTGSAETAAVGHALATTQAPADEAAMASAESAAGAAIASAGTASSDTVASADGVPSAAADCPAGSSDATIPKGTGNSTTGNSTTTGDTITSRNTTTGTATTRITT